MLRPPTRAPAGGGCAAGGASGSGSASGSASGSGKGTKYSTGSGSASASAGSASSAPSVSISVLQKFFTDLNILLCPGACSNDQSFLPGYNGNTAPVTLPLPSGTTCTNSNKVTNCNAKPGKSTDAPGPDNTQRLLRWIYNAYLTKSISSLGYTVTGNTSGGNLYSLLELQKTGFGYNTGTPMKPKHIPTYNITWLANQIKSNAVDSQTTMVAEDLLASMYDENKTYGVPFQTALNTLQNS